MKVSMKTVLNGYDGKALMVQDPGDEQARQFTVRDAIVTSLNSNIADEVLTAEKKAKIFHLTSKIYKEQDVDLTLDELSFINERAGQVLAPIAYGRLMEVIDPADSKTKK